MLPPKEGDTPEAKQIRYDQIWQQLQAVLRKQPFDDLNLFERVYRDENSERFYIIKRFESLKDVRESFFHPYHIDQYKLTYPIYNLDSEIQQPLKHDGSIQTHLSSLGPTPEYFQDSQGNNFAYERSIIMAQNKSGQIAIFRCENFDGTIESPTGEVFPQGPDGAPAGAISFELVDPDSEDLQNIETALSEILEDSLVY